MAQGWLAQMLHPLVVLIITLQYVLEKHSLLTVMSYWSTPRIPPKEQELQLFIIGDLSPIKYACNTWRPFLHNNV